jgi:hypothetical protein
MPTVIDECKVLLSDYQWAIRKLSTEYYDEYPYKKLPEWSRLDIKAGAKTYAKMRIEDLITRGK